MNRLFSNRPHFHITFTVLSRFRKLLFEKRSLTNAVYLFYVQTSLPVVFRKLLLIQTFCLDRHSRFLFTFSALRVRLPCFLAFRSISPVLFLQP
uniref:Uncharacterized protein n=1 Tax=Candidatus Kentrum sp. TC TaxID=2126339 RepID=A0A450YJZ9_9GAMM|nr:MAG: hypothetical protein BECKTC1821E_GA0114239_10159 [Candidatus Kentron sp. TC]